MSVGDLNAGYEQDLVDSYDRDVKLTSYAVQLQRAHNRLVESSSAYEQGEAEGISFALDIFDSYFGARSNG